MAYLSSCSKESPNEKTIEKIAPHLQRSMARPIERIFKSSQPLLQASQWSSESLVFLNCLQNRIKGF